MMKHCLSGLELTPANTLQLLALAQEQKHTPKNTARLWQAVAL